MSHFSEVENLISCFFPEKASFNEMDKSYLKSEPLLFDFLDLLPPPKPSPKKSSKISENEPEKSKFPNPPLPPPPLSNAACPKLS